MPETSPHPCAYGAAKSDMSGGVVIVGIAEHILEVEVEVMAIEEEGAPLDGVPGALAADDVIG